MKKRASTLSFFVLAFVLLLYSCGTQALPNSYIPNSDHQYMQVGSGAATVQQTEDGCYVIRNGYLYYIEEGTDILLPLCSKADCLHDKEAKIPLLHTKKEEQERLDKCNACVDAMEMDDATICYSDGYLYCLNPIARIEGIGYMLPALYRCAPDGSQKELIRYWSEDVQITDWCVHRGVLYYVEQKFASAKDGVRRMCSLYAIPIKGMNHRPDVIFETEETLEVMTLNRLACYGDYLYCTLIAYASGNEPLTEENAIEYLYRKTFVYTISDRQIGEIKAPGMTKYQVIQGLDFWQDRIIFNVYDYMNKDQGCAPLYIADLDGSDVQVLIEDAPVQHETDGQYLYLFDLHTSYRNGEDSTYWTYNSDMELVDTFQVPFDSNYGYGRALGGYPQAYIPIRTIQGEERMWSLAYWDKSKIGTYNGGMIEVEYITR